MDAMRGTTKRAAILVALLFAVSFCWGQQITRAEYYIDSDPGFGLAEPIPVNNPGNLLSLDFNADAGGLSQGFHTIGIRARDNLGRWSHARHQIFYLAIIEDISGFTIDRIEYFVDVDPGFGLATEVAISDPGPQLDLGFEVPTEALSQGFHTMVVRARDEKGRWSLAQQQIFYVIETASAEASEVTAVEYFVDEDPGFGMGTSVEVASPGNDVEVDFLVDLGGISDGDHILYIRSKDALERWSHTMMHAFTLNATGLGDQEVVPWFRMYPNPNAGNFILEFNDLKEPAELRITDINGRVVHVEKIDDRYTTVTAELAPGVYLLTIDSGNQYFKKKLIIGR